MKNFNMFSYLHLLYRLRRRDWDENAHVILLNRILSAGVKCSKTGKCWTVGEWILMILAPIGMKEDSLIACGVLRKAGIEVLYSDTEGLSAYAQHKKTYARENLLRINLSNFTIRKILGKDDGGELKHFERAIYNVDNHTVLLPIIHCLNWFEEYMDAIYLTQRHGGHWQGLEAYLKTLGY